MDHLEGRTPVYYSEHRVRRIQGDYVWVMDHGKVVEWADDGSPVRLVGAHTDISKRKAAEKALRESEERLKLALDATEDAFWDWNMRTGEVVSSFAVVQNSAPGVEGGRMPF